MKIPTGRSFYNSLLLTLAEKTKHKPLEFVPCQDLYGPVILGAGFDPDNLEQYGPPEEGWRRTGRVPAGFNTRVARASYALKKPTLSRAILIAKSNIRGYWGLTQAGVREARWIKAQQIEEKTGKNITSQFLDDVLRRNRKLWFYFIHKIAKKFPKSRESGMEADHLGEAFLKMIRKNSLKKILLETGTVETQKLTHYIFNSIRTEYKTGGREPLLRELLGARTITDLPCSFKERRTEIALRKKMAMDQGYLREDGTFVYPLLNLDELPNPLPLSESKKQRYGGVPQTYNDINSAEELTQRTTEFIDPRSYTEEFEDAETFQFLMGRISNVIGKRKRAHQMERVIALQAEGVKRDEIMEECGLTVAEIHSINTQKLKHLKNQEVRDILQQSC